MYQANSLSTASKTNCQILRNFRRENFNDQKCFHILLTTCVYVFLLMMTSFEGVWKMLTFNNWKYFHFNDFDVNICTWQMRLENSNHFKFYYYFINKIDTPDQRFIYYTFRFFFSPHSIWVLNILSTKMKCDAEYFHHTYKSRQCHCQFY